MKVFGSPFALNWADKDAVIAYARKLGPGVVVIQRPGRDNFNIVHASRPDLYTLSMVVYRT